MVAAREGRSRWITGPLARTFAHRLRLRHAAVLVGADTVRRDDPRLNARLADEKIERLRVVLTAGGDLDPAARLFRGRGPGTRVYTTATSAPDLRRRLDGLAQVVGFGPASVYLVRIDEFDLQWLERYRLR